MLGQPTYPYPKGQGDHSMSVKHGSMETIKVDAVQDLCSMVKAKLLESQFPAMKSGIGGKRWLKPTPVTEGYLLEISFCSHNRPGTRE